MSALEVRFSLQALSRLSRHRDNRDKGPAEAGVLLVERWILGHLRHEYFTNWEAAHTAVSA